MAVLRFEGFTLDVPGCVLMRGGKRLALRRQPFKVLAYLAQHPGRLVSTKELIDKCWDNPKHTSVNSLAQCIKAIRGALRKTDHEIIRTVHGQGYVLTPPVLTMPRGRPPVAAASRAPERSAKRARQMPIGACASTPAAARAGLPSAEIMHVLREATHRLLRQKRHALTVGVVLAGVLLAGVWAVWSH